MTREEIINGLKMSMELTLFDPSTGEVMEPWQLNDINRTAYEAYKGAIELLEKHPDTTIHEYIHAETSENDGDRTSGDCISRQMAIDALKEKVFHNLSDEFYGAMQVLDELPSAQPETNCSKFPNNSDVISRQAAIDFVGSMNMCDEISNEACKKLTSYLDELPSIQPERKTGRWLPDNTDYYRTKFICSACGESEEVPTTGFGYGTMWGYCPNCGAKMEGGEAE